MIGLKPGALVGLRPHVLVVRDPDELRRDAHPVARALNRTFDDRVHAELPTDFGQP